MASGDHSSFRALCHTAWKACFTPSQRNGGGAAHLLSLLGKRPSEQCPMRAPYSNCQRQRWGALGPLSPQKLVHVHTAGPV